MTLAEEIRLGETQSLEFKRIPTVDRVKYQKTAVAFANGRGGRILFGVANDRTVIGVSRDALFTEMDAIVNSISDACEPKIPLDVSIEDIEGKAVIVLEVFAGTRCPYYVKAEGEKDGVYVRVGATTRQADDATRHEMALQSEGRSFDREPCPKAKIDDKKIAALCARMFKIARLNCGTDIERRAVKRVTADQLESWGIVSRSHGRWIASNAYALLTGDKALPVRVRCGVFKGDDRAVFIDRREFDGSVCDLVEQSLSYILAKINMGCDFVGTQRRDVYELPPVALRELIVNAFVHRNYFDYDAPVFVAVYDTRVEIVSPGGLPRGLSREEALSGSSRIRNHALAAAFNYMRYVEGWGSGYKRVNEQLAAAGIDAASMEVSNGSVRVDVYRKTKGDEQIKSSIETKESAIGAKKSAIESLLSSFQLTRPTHDNIVKLYLALDENEIFGRQTIMKITGLSSSAAGTFLSGVLNLEILDQVTGHGKGKYRFRKP